MGDIENLTRRQKSLALVTLIVAVVLEIVDLTIVNTALPAIKSDLGANAEAAQWVVAGYALSFALFLMAGGRLGTAMATGACSCSALQGSRSLPSVAVWRKRRSNWSPRA